MKGSFLAVRLVDTVPEASTNRSPVRGPTAKAPKGAQFAKPMRGSSPRRNAPDRTGLNFATIHVKVLPGLRVTNRDDTLGIVDICTLKARRGEQSSRPFLFLSITTTWSQGSRAPDRLGSREFWLLRFPSRCWRGTIPCWFAFMEAGDVGAT